MKGEKGGSKRRQEGRGVGKRTALLRQKLGNQRDTIGNEGENCRTYRNMASHKKK